MDMNYNNIEFSPMERKIAGSFKNAEIYPDDIDDMLEWEDVLIPAFK